MKKVIALFFFRFTKFPKKRFFRYDTVISLGGFIVSIAVLTAALTLLNGYQKALKEGLLGVSGHVYVYNAHARTFQSEEVEELSRFLEKQPEVVSYSPVVVTQAMASFEGNEERVIEQGASVRGVTARSINWRQKQLPIKYRELISKGTGELHGTNDIVIGEKLQQYMNIDVGDEITLISPANIRFTVFGLQTGELRAKVVGLYSSGVYETDAKTMFLNEEAIHGLVGERNAGNYNIVEVSVGDEHVDRANELAGNWSRQKHYNYFFDSWIDYQGNLFTMLVVQRWVIFIILSFIIIIASFGIASNTSKTIMEKRKEIGILSAIGADNSLIKSFIMGEITLGAVISIIGGVLAGIAAGWALTKQTVLMLRGDVYFIEHFKIEVDPFTTAAIILVSLAIAVTASWLAIRKVAKLTAIETLMGK